MQAVLHADGSLTWIGDGGSGDGVPQMARAVFGRAGIRAEKREGDGATPAGVLRLRRVLYRADREKPPACAVPVEPIAPTDGWCDDTDDAAYNRMVTLPYVGHCEELWRDDSLYDIVGVLGWNDAPVQPGRGSAIFLHAAPPNGAPTDGCIALPAGDLRALLAAGVTEIRVLPHE